MNPNPDSSLVYIVDDEESARKGLSLLLRSAGMACRTFSSVEQFLAEVSPRPGDCVLLDLTMPRMTGLDFLKELNRRKFHPPVIVISARDDAETSTLARQLGARFFLRKPVDDQALIDAIHWVLASDFPEPTNIRHPGSHDGQGA
jgi:FixJ family two-component response regulator